MKTLASIGAAALVVLILLYANGYFQGTDRMKGRSQFHSTGQGVPESESKRQRVEEEERQRMVREAEQQRIAQEEERLRNAREADRQRLAREESERQRVAREPVDPEKQRVAQEEERQHKAQEEERQPVAQEEAEKKKSDNDLKQCLQAAEEAYSANWERACRQIDSPPKCILPALVLARFDGPRRDTRDECAKLYPVK